MKYYVESRKGADAPIRIAEFLYLPHAFEFVDSLNARNKGNGICFVMDAVTDEYIGRSWV